MKDKCKLTVQRSFAVRSKKKCTPTLKGRAEAQINTKLVPTGNDGT